MKLKAGLQALAAGVVLAFGAVKAEAAIIDLGFALDASGSIGSSNFVTARNALSAALGQIPFSGPDTYRVSVVRFDTTATTVTTQTINSAAALASVQAAVAATSYPGGATCISCATTQLLTNFQGLGGLGDFTLFNVITDGEPTVGTTSGATLRTSLTAAGVDGISAEAIGAFDLSFLQALVAPNPGVTTNNPAALPDPYTSGFVLTVANFAGFQAAIDQKIRNIVVTPPGTIVPGPIAGAGLPALLALGGFVWARRRKAVAA
jgi:hypothetical protein